MYCVYLLSVIKHTPRRQFYLLNSKPREIRFQIKVVVLSPLINGVYTISRPCLWVPVTTAWRVLRLRMEEWTPIWRVAAN